MSAAIVSIRAPLRPWFANSFVATARISAFVRSESLFRDRAVAAPGFFVTIRASMHVSSFARSGVSSPDLSGEQFAASE